MLPPVARPPPAPRLSLAEAYRAGANSAAADSGGFELLAVESCIQPVGGKQLGVRAAFDDAAPLVDQDQVRPQDRREPVGDGDRGPACLQPLEGLLDQALADRVEGGRGLVEDQDPGVLQQHPGDGDALLLAAGELVAALADDRVVAVRQLHDPVVDRCRTGRRLQLGVGPPGRA